MDVSLVMLPIPDELDPSMQAEITRELVEDAAQQNNVDVVSTLLKAGVDKDSYDSHSGRTALLVAADKGHVELAGLLLRARASATVQDHDGNTALMLATARGSTEIVRLIVKCDLDTPAGRWSWFFACDRGTRSDLEVIQTFIRCRFDIDSRDPNTGNTALHIAASHGRTEFVLVLCVAGCDTGLADSSGKTPLHAASERGHLHAARLLLDWYAEADSCDHRGNTALHLASDNGHAELVRLLLSYDATG